MSVELLDTFEDRYRTAFLAQREVAAATEGAERDLVARRANAHAEEIRDAAVEVLYPRAKPADLLSSIRTFFQREEREVAASAARVDALTECRRAEAIFDAVVRQGDPNAGDEQLLAPFRPAHEDVVAHLDRFAPGVVYRMEVANQRAKNMEAALREHLREEGVHPALIDCVVSFSKDRASENFGSNEYVKDYTVATEAFVGRPGSGSVRDSAGHDMMVIHRLFDGAKMLIPLDPRLWVLSENELRFEPWHGEFYVSSLSERGISEERELEPGDVVDVCVLGGPAINGCCGDALCECGPAPGLSPKLVEWEIQIRTWQRENAIPAREALRNAGFESVERTRVGGR